MSLAGRRINNRILVMLAMFLAGAVLDFALAGANLLLNTIITMYIATLLIYWQRTLAKRIINRNTVALLFCVNFALIALGLVRLYALMVHFGVIVFVYSFVIEICIHTGVIPTNTDYDKFFSSANIPAIITDTDGEVVHMTEASRGYDFDFPSRHQEVRSIQIKGGNVIWAQDLTELADLNTQLEEIRSRLSEENSLLHAENTMINRNARIESQTQIYEELTKIIQPSLQNIIFEIQCAESSDSKEPLAMACFYTSYVKRRSNLMLIESDTNKIHSSELGNCLNETIDSLKLLKIGVSISGRFDGYSQRNELIKAYDAFQHIIEMNLDSMEYMLVYLSTEVGIHKITIMMSGDGVCNRTQLRNDYIYYFDEEEATHYFNISFIKERE